MGITESREKEIAFMAGVALKAALIPERKEKSPRGRFRAGERTGRRNEPPRRNKSEHNAGCKS